MKTTTPTIKDSTIHKVESLNTAIELPGIPKGATLFNLTNA